MECLATLGCKLEVAIYVGVVVMHVIFLLLHCGGLDETEQLQDLAVIVHLSVSELFMYICMHIHTYVCRTCVRACVRTYVRMYVQYVSKQS